MTLLAIRNDGPEIAETNYFGTAQARAGYVYLSTNAGCFRLLIPGRILPDMLREISAAQEVIVSRGPWPERGRPDALEIMFEDGTDAPYALHIGTEQTDRIPEEGDQGKPWTFTVWGPAGKALTLPCRYRLVPRIPWMQPYREE